MRLETATGTRIPSFTIEKQKEKNRLSSIFLSVSFLYIFVIDLFLYLETASNVISFCINHC